MDFIDKLIERCATSLHEGRRQQGVERRHRKERESEARRRLDELWDRIELHFPVTKRESRPDLSNKQFRQLLQAEEGHRLQLFMMLVRSLALDNGEPPQNPLDF